MDLLAIRTRIERAWSAETSYEPEAWEHLDPAWGQCAVTACLLHELVDYHRGIRKGRAVNQEWGINVSHYWNLIHGVDVDLTWRQFPAGTELWLMENVEYSPLKKSVKNRLDILRKNYEELV